MIDGSAGIVGFLLRLLSGKKGKKKKKWPWIVAGFVLMLVIILGVVASSTGLKAWLSSWVIIMQKEKEEEAEEEKNWQWDPVEEQIPSGNNSSGIGVTDPVLRNWQLYFEYNAKAKEAQGSVVPIWEYIGLGFQESGTTIPSTLNNAGFDISKDLVTSKFCQTSNGVCLRGWSEAEHFLNGGTMYNDFPKNDPNRNHALGPCQFDQSGIANKLRVYQNPSISGANWYVDETLGFTRPNAWYLPDCIQSFYSQYTINHMDTVSSMSGFSSLSESNKQFIYAIRAHANYNGGSINDDIQTIINAGNSGVDLYAAVQNTSYAGTIWNSSTMSTSGGFASQSKKDEAAAALGVTFTNSHTGTYVISAWAGKLCYDDIMNKINENLAQQGSSSSGESGTGGSEAPSSSSDILTMADYVYNTMRVELPIYLQGSAQSATFGTVRPDCSGMTSLILYQMGLCSSKTAYWSGSFLDNVMGFQVISNWNDMQPGDIVAWTGHVCIYAGNNSWYTWGSTNAAKNNPIPDPGYHNYANRKYNTSSRHIILRVPGR